MGYTLDNRNPTVREIIYLEVFLHSPILLHGRVLN
jgi:hypothetical protein